ncbi:protein ORF43 [Cyprinid herpesvirus 1]|uniref:Protein ORF43 n=1 Tax=Cyprinid herpesvirus 1 TaxID=317858 RepID=K7PBC6_9VIRU|nr:protein ORF43 [Cyprinid herpesvirus 1]AFJ20344.1 protein ORF43 [Cyprinid herpesvirus 1]
MSELEGQIARLSENLASAQAKLLSACVDTDDDEEEEEDVHPVEGTTNLPGNSAASSLTSTVPREKSSSLPVPKKKKKGADISPLIEPAQEETELLHSEWSHLRRERSGFAEDWSEYWKNFLDVCEAWQITVLEDGKSHWAEEEAKAKQLAQQCLADHDASLAEARKDRDKYANALLEASKNFGRDGSRDISVMLTALRNEMILHSNLSACHGRILSSLVTYMIKTVVGTEKYAQTQLEELRKAWVEGGKALLDIHQLGGGISVLQESAKAALLCETEYKLQTHRYSYEKVCAQTLSSYVEKFRNDSIRAIDAAVNVGRGVVKELDDAIMAVDGRKRGKHSLLHQYNRRSKDVDVQNKRNRVLLKDIRKSTAEVRARIYQVFTAWRQQPSTTFGATLRTLLDFYAKCLEESAVVRVESRMVEVVGVLSTRFPDYFTEAMGLTDRVLLEKPIWLNKSLSSIARERPTSSIAYAGKWNPGEPVGKSKLYNTIRADAIYESTKTPEDGSIRAEVDHIIKVNGEPLQYEGLSRVSLCVKAVGGGSTSCAVYPTCDLEYVKEWLGEKNKDLSDAWDKAVLRKVLVSTSEDAVDDDASGSESEAEAEDNDPKKTISSVPIPTVKLLQTDKMPTLEMLVGAAGLVDLRQLREEDLQWYSGALERYLYRCVCLSVLSDILKPSEDTYCALLAYASHLYNAHIASVFYLNTGSWTFRLLSAACEAETTRVGKLPALKVVPGDKTAPSVAKCFEERDNLLDWPRVNQEQQNEATGFTVLSTWVRFGTCARVSNTLNKECRVPISADKVPRFGWDNPGPMPITAETREDSTTDPDHEVDELLRVTSAWAREGNVDTIDQDDALAELIAQMKVEDEEEDGDDRERMMALEEDINLEDLKSYLGSREDEDDSSEVGPAFPAPSSMENPTPYELTDTGLFDDVGAATSAAAYEAPSVLPRAVDLLTYYTSGSLGAALSRYFKARVDVTYAEVEEHMNMIWHHMGRSDPSEMFRSKEVGNRVGFIEKFLVRVKNTNPVSLEDTQNLALDAMRYVSKLSDLQLELTREREAELDEAECI